MLYDILHITSLVIGIGIFIDGIGSIIVRGEQYHSIWFDGERLVRAAAGVALVVFAIFA
jgi:hypothetical protein